MSVTITDRDNGYEHLRFALRNVDNNGAILIGVNENPHEGSAGLTNADVGKFHEFGTRDIPERSFLRAWIDRADNNWSAQLGFLLKGWLFNRGGDWKEAFGKWAVGEIRARMRRGIAPPLDASTAQRKGSNIPLIDTEQLINAVEWQIEDGQK